jgi:hypothetical protein
LVEADFREAGDGAEPFQGDNIRTR